MPLQLSQTSPSTSPTASQTQIASTSSGHHQQPQLQHLYQQQQQQQIIQNNFEKNLQNSNESDV